MFKILPDKTICLTRGDVANIVTSAVLQDETPFTFKEGDIVRMQILDKKNYGDIKLRKDITVEEECISVTIKLGKEDTKIGEIINKPVEYHYEIEVNPDGDRQTIVGYDDDGPKIFRLYPEGADS